MTKKSNGGDAIHIGQAISNLLSSYHIKSKFDAANIVGSWERLVGKPIAKRTKKVFIKDRVLFVQIESAAMKHDISLHKGQILEIFQKEFGAEVVREIALI
jgi:predicted nucleic acid-binding Zn ribbon protein